MDKFYWTIPILEFYWLIQETVIEFRNSHEIPKYRQMTWIDANQMQSTEPPGITMEHQ